MQKYFKLVVEPNLQFFSKFKKEFYYKIVMYTIYVNLKIINTKKKYIQVEAYIDRIYTANIIYTKRHIYKII